MRLLLSLLLFCMLTVNSQVVVHTRRGFDISAIALLPSEHILQSLVAFDSQDGEATILAGLCHAEENGPKDALRCCTDGQKHLGK